VVEINGQKITSDDSVSIAKTISQKKIGDEIKIKLVRGGKKMEFMVKLEKKI
jgi:S1-C subfamily serine protease